MPAEGRHRHTDVVSIAHLEHLLGWNRSKIQKYASEAGRYYNPFDRQRVAGEGKWRHIDNPVGQLRELQGAIQRNILARAALPEFMLGGVKGRSIKDNAKIHARKPMVLTIDVRNCFPSVTNKMVFDALSRELGFRGEPLRLVTKLTTFHRRLPQGAPTSTTLANLALIPVYERIVQIAAANGLAMSFWIDDIALSGYRPQNVIDEVIGAVQAEGLSISRSKLKVVARESGPQNVTGVVANRGVSFGTRKLQSLREEIIDLANAEEIPDFRIRSINGKIQHVAHLKPSQARRLRRLADLRLPNVGLDGPSPRTDKTRDCKNAKRHRYG